MKVDGTIIAPDAISAWDGLNNRTWLLFQDLNNFYIQGKGTFNGRGYNWWDCKRSKICPEAPTVRHSGFFFFFFFEVINKHYLWSHQCEGQVLADKLVTNGDKLFLGVDDLVFWCRQ